MINNSGCFSVPAITNFNIDFRITRFTDAKNNLDMLMNTCKPKGLVPVQGQACTGLTFILYKACRGFSENVTSTQRPGI